MNKKIRTPIFERVCTITGLSHPIQYAVSGSGRVYRRFWIRSVIPGRVRRDGSPTPSGRWESWSAIDGSLPKEVRETGKFAVI